MEASEGIRFLTHISNILSQAHYVTVSIEGDEQVYTELEGYLWLLHLAADLKDYENFKEVIADNWQTSDPAVIGLFYYVNDFAGYLAYEDEKIWQLSQKYDLTINNPDDSDILTPGLIESLSPSKIRTVCDFIHSEFNLLYFHNENVRKYKYNSMFDSSEESQDIEEGLPKELNNPGCIQRLEGLKALGCVDDNYQPIKGKFTGAQKKVFAKGVGIEFDIYNFNKVFERFWHIKDLGQQKTDLAKNLDLIKNLFPQTVKNQI